MTTEVIATPEKIRELFNNNFIKLDNGNFLVPRGIENNKGHFNLTDDCFDDTGNIEIGINGQEIKARDFDKSRYIKLEVFVFYWNNDIDHKVPIHFYKAESVINAVEVIQKHSDDDIEGGFQVDYNLHKDGSLAGNQYRSLRGSEIGLIKLQEDGYKPRRKYKI